MLDGRVKQQALIKAFKHAPIGKGILDTDGKFLMVNASYGRITGYEEEELLQLSFQDITHEEDLENDLSQWQKLISEQIDYYQMEKRYIRKDGQIIWVFISVSMFKDEEDQTFVIAQVQNIDRRKKAEDELRLRETRYRKLVDNFPDPMVVHDHEKFLYVNKAALRALELPAEEVLGKKMKDFVHEESAEIFQQKVEYALKNGITSDTLQLRLNLPNGKEMYIQSTASFVQYEGKAALEVVFRDVTDRVAYESHSSGLLEQLEKMNLVGELAAGIAHEIRNPLTILKGFIQLMELSEREGDAPQYEGLIMSEIERINEMVHEFMDLAKPSVEEHEPVDIAATLQQVIRLMATQARKSKVFIEFYQASELPEIACEENKMKQAFINILKNAIEAMPEGGEITVRVEAVEDELIITFRDMGIGIPEGSYDVILKPFFTTKSEGSGLGLMITKNIVENHGGMLDIQNNESIGATVRISLPLGD